MRLPVLLDRRQWRAGVIMFRTAKRAVLEGVPIEEARMRGIDAGNAYLREHGGYRPEWHERTMRREAKRALRRARG